MEEILTRMQGTWAIESALESGEPVEQGAARLVIAGDRFERRTPAHVFTRQIDVRPPPGNASSQGVAWIDLEITNEPGLGRVLYGLVEVVGERMRICHARAGEPRPTEFSSTATNRNILSISRKTS